jgi:RNA polymerase sigma-70 factor (ECF subfamily)
VAVLEHPDLEIVRRVRDGDASAFDQIVDRFADELYAVACSLLGNRADAEDAVQETLLGAFRGVGTFQGRSSLKTWLYRILFNKASKARESRTRRRMAPLEAVTAGGGSEEPARQVSSPAEQFESSADVEQMLAALSPEHREVIILRELRQLSYDEIADVLSVPVGTVESRLHRARQDLKKKFDGYFQ